MAERDLPPVPYKVQFLDGQGFVNQAWAAWFRQLFSRVGGHAAKTNIELDVTRPGSITTPLLADRSVTAAKLADDATIDGNRAVTTNHIRDSAVTTPKIADSAVTSAKLEANIVIPGTGAVQIPAGTTGGRPTGASGKLRFNTDTSLFEGFTGSAWASVGTPGPAGSTGPQGVAGPQGPTGPPGGAVNTSFVVSSFDGSIYANSQNGNVYTLS